MSALEDAPHRVGVEATVLLSATDGSDEGLLTVVIAQAQEGADMHGCQGLHTQLQPVDERREPGEALDEGFVEPLRARGASSRPPRQVGIVGAVQDEFPLVLFRDVGARKGDFTRRSQHLEVVGKQAHGHRVVRQRGGGGGAGTPNRESGIMVYDSCARLMHGETRFGQLAEQGLLLAPRLVGYPASCPVEAEVTDLGSLVQPHRASLIEVLPGGEFRAFEQVVPDQAEGLLVLALSIGIADSAREGLEAKMTCKVQEAQVPERLSIGSNAPQVRGGHVVEDYAVSHTTKVREGVSQPFEQRR